MDVHVPRAITNGLRRRGVQVVTAQEYVDVRAWASVYTGAVGAGAVLRLRRGEQDEVGGRRL